MEMTNQGLKFIVERCPLRDVPPTGAISHSHGVLHGRFCMAKMRYFRATGMIFPRLPLLYMEFEGIWGQYFAIGSE
jgi:hypothetical protein